MNETLETLKTRRSIRAFKEDDVPQELIEQIMEAGLYAPTGKGEQDPIIVEIADKEIREKLRRDNAIIGGWEPSHDPFYHAPVILVVLAPASWPMAVEDGSLVIGNLLNATQAVGLRGIWIHRAKQEFEMPEWKEWLKEIGVKGEYRGIGHVAIGYPAVPDPKPAPRKEGRIFRIL